MPLHDVMTENNVESRFRGMPPQAKGLRGRILAVIIQVDQVSSPRMAPARKNGVVFAKIACEFYVSHGHTCLTDELTADGRCPIGTAIIDQHDLMSARNLERLDVTHKCLNGVFAVVHRDDETEGEVSHARGRPFFSAAKRMELPAGRTPNAARQALSMAIAPRRPASTGAGSFPTSLPFCFGGNSFRRATIRGSGSRFQCVERM